MPIVQTIVGVQLSEQLSIDNCQLAIVTSKQELLLPQLRLAHVNSQDYNVEKIDINY